MVQQTSRDGAHILLHSGQYPGLILDVITIATKELRDNPDKYAAFLRSIFRAIDFYDKDPDKAIALMAPHFDLSPAEFKESMDSGVDYMSYEENVELFGTPDVRGTVYENFDALMEISIDVDMADAPLSADVAYGAHHAVVNVDTVDFLKKAVQDYNIQPLAAARAVDLVEEASQMAAGNINPQLIVAGLMMDLRRALIVPATVAGGTAR